MVCQWGNTLVPCGKLRAGKSGFQSVESCAQPGCCNREDEFFLLFSLVLTSFLVLLQITAFCSTTLYGTECMFQACFIGTLE